MNFKIGCSCISLSEKSTTEVLIQMYIDFSAGDVEELGRTHEYLVNSVKSKANVCLICIETVKRNEPVSLIHNNEPIFYMINAKLL